MRTRRVMNQLAASLAGVLVTASLAVAQGAGRRYSPDDWMTVTSVGSFVWSPDGAYFYYTSDAGDSGTDEIFRVSSGGGAPVQLSKNPPGVRPEPKGEVTLSADGRTIFFTSARYFQNISNIFRMPASGGEATALTFNDAIIETSPAPSPDGTTLAYFTRTPRGTKIYLLALDAGVHWPRLFSPGPEAERDPVWSSDGSVLAFSRAGDTWIQPVAGGPAKRLVEGPYSGSVGGPVWAPDGKRVAFTSGRSGFGQIAVVDLETGQVTPLTYEPREHSSPAWSPDGKSIVYVVNDGLGMSRQIVVVSADGQGAPRVLTRGPGIRRSPQFSPDGRTIAYVETTGNRTADIWTLPAAGGTPKQITNSMGRVNPADLGNAEEITYPGPDNLQIPGILRKPRGFDPSRKYPVIVRLHGHPGQWNHTFNVMEQYFLDRGYVLVSVNPRGSVGFGQGFHDLHEGDYGGTELEDVMAVLPYLEKLGYVDMTRKATWGGSGGGYMSLTVATARPQAFQAQAIRAPVSSWKNLAMERYVSPGRFNTPTREPQRAREEFGGAYTDIPERYDERSPLNFVENVTVPQLLFQGLRDSSVPPNESKRWAARMRELGKGDLIEYVEYPDEDHGLTRYRATIRDRLQRMERFFAKHLDLGGVVAQ